MPTKHKQEEIHTIVLYSSQIALIKSTLAEAMSLTGDDSQLYTQLDWVYNLLPELNK